MPHRETIKHVHEPGHFHELTFSCYRRLPLLLDDVRRLILAECIDQACQEAEFDLVSFVFMPEHVHLLVYPRPDRPDIGRFLARVKQPASSRIKADMLQTDPQLVKDLTVRERPGKYCFRFWQEGPGYDRNLYTPSAIQNSIDYMHKNPVDRTLCSQAIDWPWSSARYYLEEPPRTQHPGLPHIHGPPPGTLD